MFLSTNVLCACQFNDDDDEEEKQMLDGDYHDDGDHYDDQNDEEGDDDDEDKVEEYVDVKPDSLVLPPLGRSPVK